MGTCSDMDRNTDRSAKPLLSVLAGVPSAVPPFWLMRQAGRYLPEYRSLRAEADGFLDFCYDPALAAEATLQPIRRFGMDAAIVFSDILVIPDALGMTVSFTAGAGPRLEALEPGRAAVSRLSAAPPAGRLSAVCETIARVRAALPPRTALVGFAGAPWTLATYMVEGGSSRDFARVKAWAYGDPGSFAALISLLERAVADHLAAQIRAGAEAVQVFDSWAGVLPSPAFERWCVEPVARIVAAVKAAHPDVPVIGFPRGAGYHYDSYAARTGVDAVSLDTTVSVAKAAALASSGAAVQGNLDPVSLLVGGETLASSVAALRRGLCRRPWIFNLGHGVLPGTPPDHVAALAGLLRADPDG